MRQKMLVIDESRIQRVILKRLLEQHSFEVCEADSTEEAIQCLSTEGADLVIADFNLPGVQDCSFGLLLQKDPVLSAVPLIVTSSLVDIELDSIHRVGAALHISRPYDEDVLLNAISTLLDTAHYQHIEAENNTLRSAVAAFEEAWSQDNVMLESRRSFLTKIKHDVRTPLNAILGLSFLLRQAESKADRDLYLNQLEEASSSLLSVFDQRLDDDARDDSDSIGALCERVVDRVVDISLAGRESISIDIKNGSKTRVVGPLRMVEEAIFNLVEFSLRHHDGNKITLSIDKRQSNITFSVYFSGSITQAQSAHLFDSNRGDNTEYGLLLANAIAQRCQGEAGYELMATRHHLWLSICMQSIEGETAAGGAAMEDLPKLTRVMIVDDEPVNRKITAAMLEKLGVTVTQCASGNEALQKLAEENADYALIFMDQLMPDLDGMQTTIMIRRLPKWADIPIIGLSANSDDESRDACMQAGMNDYLQKSPNPAPLYAAVSRWLNLSVDGQSTEQCGSQASLARLVAALPMLDAQVARRLVQGESIDSVRELLAEFADRYRDASHHLTQLVDEGDIDSAIRLAHSVKGTAATLGLIAVSKAADAIEAALRHNPASSVAHLCKSLDEQLTAFTVALKSCLHKTKANVEASTPVNQALEHLSSLLAHDNPLAYDYLEANYSTFERYSREFAVQLRELIGDYDLSDALALTESCRVKLQREGN